MKIGAALNLSQQGGRNPLVLAATSRHPSSLIYYFNLTRQLRMMFSLDLTPAQNRDRQQELMLGLDIFVQEQMAETGLSKSKRQNTSLERRGWV